MQTKPFAGRQHILRLLRGLHFIGLAMFLGTIIANIAISRSIDGGGLPVLADGRRLISLLSHHLVLQGLGLMAVTGILMTVLRFGTRPPAWVVAKLACVMLIVAISLAFLFPALDEATRWARLSASQNQLLPEFDTWLARESRFGMLNLLLFLGAGALALWRPSFKRSADRRSPD